MLAGIKVGTVDKFQGQRAPVMLFTMSTSDDLPRGQEFLLSRNRRKVALSRAKSVDEMKLISTLCFAVDSATGTRRTLST